MTILVRRFAPLIRPMFSVDVLRQSLAFGLPRVPHAAAQQVIAVGDKFILAVFRPIAEVGIYSMGVSFGLTQKLFLSAFEYAWAPFYYSAARERGAAALFATVTTYGVAAPCAADGWPLRHRPRPARSHDPWRPRGSRADRRRGRRSASSCRASTF